MARTVGIGIQDFDKIITNHYFYIDKTIFLKEWWESGDDVTLITRPRRFGKTLTMSMAERFFSIEHENDGYIFEGLEIWKDEKFRAIQGTYPVISLSFANMKEKDYMNAKRKMNELLVDVYEKNSFIRDSGILSAREISYYDRIAADMDDSTASLALYRMSDYLCQYYGKKVIILLDEYDTPMQEAYVDGYWEDMVAYTRSLFNATFKTNPNLERAIMTGITRVSKESVFSDLNNLEVVTTTAGKYTTAFGFTEAEVFAAMDEFGYAEKEAVKDWYDGFIFGESRDIYNPWSILNYLDKHRLAVYWANTSSNSLVGKLLREGNKGIKQKFENLLDGESITAEIDEQIVYSQLNGSQNAVWSLLLASGYLKVLSVDNTAMLESYSSLEKYELTLTNREVRFMFMSMIKGWFGGRSEDDYNDFIKALLSDNKKLMNRYMNRVALETISYFDSGNRPAASEPERFYHGFVLGLLVELREKYIVKSNRESGFGRYDIMLEPRNCSDTAIIIEFKVFDEDEEDSLEDTVNAALVQIEEKKYEQELLNRGIARENIRKYGFAFQGKRVLIG